MGVQIVEDAAQWKKRKESIEKEKYKKAVYGLLALVCFALSFTTHGMFFLGFIGFGLASKA